MLVSPAVGRPLTELPTEAHGTRTSQTLNRHSVKATRAFSFSAVLHGLPNLFRPRSAFSRPSEFSYSLQDFLEMLGQFLFRSPPLTLMVLCLSKFRHTFSRDGRHPVHFLRALCLTRRLMLWLSEPLLALSIMARDTNLLLIPASIVFLVWILDAGVRANLIALASFLLTVGVPLVFFPSEQVLQHVSTWTTPLLVSPLFILTVLIMTGLSAILATHPSDMKTSNDRQVRLADLVFDAGFIFFLVLSLLFPYFIDNCMLGQE